MLSMQRAWLYFENGLFLEASSFASEGTFVAEVVFNTAMTGYQEIITDPSYAGQFVVFSMPEIGITGINPFDWEGREIHCKGVLLGNYNEYFSNFRATESLSKFLKKSSKLGICGVPTRPLVKMLRQEGAMMAVISTEYRDYNNLKEILHSSPSIQEIDYAHEVSTKVQYTYPSSESCKDRVAVIDFGVKRNILEELHRLNFAIEVFPFDVDGDTLIKYFNEGKILGVLLSNGPGDPMLLTYQIAQIKKLIAAKVPMFGICMGHQLLSIAHGYNTFKLKFGHHGGNHPVKDLQSGCVQITSQNHIYSVPQEIEDIATVTHRNLFDNTIEGLEYKHSPIFSVQFHPESSPGPRESRALFEKFARMLRS